MAAYVQLGESVPVAKGKKKAKPKAKAKKAKAAATDAVVPEAVAETPEPAKPKRVSLPKGTEAASLTLEKALKLLALPRLVGMHPETGKPIKAGVGRFGPYLHHADVYKSLPAGDDVLEIGLNRAVDLLADAKPRRSPARLLGAHPADGKPVTLSAGRYGPYVSHGKVNATIPKGREEVTIDEAVALLAARAAKGAPAKGKGRSAPPPRAKKAAGGA